MKKVLTVLLILAMVFSLAGFAVAEDSVDTMPQSACLDCGFSEGHAVSCPLYAAEFPLPEFSDACSECDGVFGEHAESCSAYVISDDESSFADVPQTGDEPVDGDDTLLPESPETPDTPQSFSGQLLAADTLEEMYSLMLSAMDEDISLLYQLTAEELAVLKSHADGLYLGIAEPVDGDDTDNWEGIISTLTVLEEEQAGVDRDVAVYGSSTTPLSGNGYIYFDLSAGNVVINANSYTGSYYDGSTTITVTGTHNADNKYYVYQSNADHKPKISGNTLTNLPNYNRVSSPLGSGTWGDYITNNSNVEEVIKNWKTEATNVGRTETQYRLDVTGSSTYDITIDNLWSSYQIGSTSRTSGGLSFTPDTNGKLTVHLVGDNRFGNIHYDATTDQNAQIIFTSDSVNPGTLTVANIVENSGTNHYNAAIGGNDSGAGNAVGIIFDGGIVFAGTTPEDNCSAIGGGGNDLGDITINGGNITAVAQSSGAAIGGGIGNTATGGKGNIIITGGFVYAYNKGSYGSSETKNPFIPAAAIGGGSSCNVNGNTGNVTISGGFVYAESLGGAAIGGGSSTRGKGGDAVVRITGGTVVAKSVSGMAKSSYMKGDGWEDFSVNAGAGIGGGTAGALGSGSGGHAELIVSGGTVNTGSIGGGGVANTGGSIGKAVVTISGGTLLGQVIMEGTGSTFTMTGGEINNANHAGYNFLQENGGAVWIQTGDASMSGGIIKNANAGNGGAIYVNGGSFAMSVNGEIQNCTATEKGGAVYVSGGKVTMSGGTINGVSAKEGGAVYVNAESTAEDSFTMSGGTIQNAKATSGNGGAVAVANGKASMSEGSIQNSIATGNGGAVAVSNGNFVISGGTIQTVGAEGSGGAVSVSGSGSVEMSGSAVIKNTTTQGDGGAVSVSGGSFTMSGGTIGGTDLEKSTAVNGGAVAVNDGAFTMSAGLIQNSTATGNGGAVYVTGGTASVSGGSMRSCSAVDGGAVYVSVTGNPTEDSFTMSSSAEIASCTATGNGGAVCVAGGNARMENGDIEKCSAVNGGAVYISNGNFTIDFGDVSSCTATGNGGAVAVLNGNFVMDSGNLTANIATGDGGGAYVNGGLITIGNVSCKDVKVATHVHPTTKDNNAKNGGAFSVSGGTLTVYCGEYSGNTAADSNSNSIYQTDGKVNIFKGVDEASLPLSEVLITGNTFVYTDARSKILTVTLCRSPDDSAPVSKLVDSTEFHSIRLNKSLLINQDSLYPGTQLMGWSVSRTDTNETVKEKPKDYYPENSRYPVTGGGNVTFYAIWGQPADVLTYTVIIPESLDIKVNGDEATIKVDTASSFFIPDGVGRVNVTLSTFSGKLTLQEKSGQQLTYSLLGDMIPLKKGDVVASFTYDKSENYQSQAVTLSARVDTEPIYAGTYQETVTFTASVVMDAYDSDTSDSKDCYMGDSP
ncbi:MAG: hypothetical protein IJA20_10010 [Methanocorpusculum sp.]|nr:hypothetical protein [Methanocorpusculum sp.]